jgi:hypothetical protein
LINKFERAADAQLHQILRYSTNFTFYQGNLIKAFLMPFKHVIVFININNQHIDDNPIFIGLF